MAQHQPAIPRGAQPPVYNPTARPDALPIAAASADFAGRSITRAGDGFGLPGRGCLCHHAEALRRHKELAAS